MRFLKRLLYVSAAGLFVLTSCAKEQTEPADKYEKIALDAWMRANRPELVGNYQQNGGYYVDILDPGKADAKPVNDTICWVRFDFTGRDLSGRIILSRSEQDAKLSGTFTKYTHYVPFYRYCGEHSNLPVEGSHLALRNKLTLGSEYFEANKVRLRIDSPEILLREGSQVDLYMPSRLVGNGLEGSGGYEGQFSLSNGKPLIVRMMVQDTVKNPLVNEGLEVDNFVALGGGVQVFDKEKNIRPTKLDDSKHPYNSPEEWANVCDSVPQLYANFRFRPETPLKFQEGTVYKSNYAPYVSFPQLEQDIAAALVKRFHSEEAYVGVKSLSDTVAADETAKIWYIGRLADGFIFDTNIDEVKELIYGKEYTKGSVMSYSPGEKLGSGGNAISAFFYTIRNLRYGQWAAMITSSTHGYGSSGRTGGTTSSSGYSSNYLDYMSYNNYYNGYFGNNGGYNNYYNDYYSMYGGGSYGNYGSNSSGTTTDSKTSVDTEILPFSPLIFELYIEPKKVD